MRNLSLRSARDPRKTQEKQRVRPLLYRVVQAACIFTAGSRELLGSRVARNLRRGIAYSDAPFLFGDLVNWSFGDLAFLTRAR